MMHRPSIRRLILFKDAQNIKSSESPRFCRLVDCLGDLIGKICVRDLRLEYETFHGRLNYMRSSKVYKGIKM